MLLSLEIIHFVCFVSPSNMLIKHYHINLKLGIFNKKFKFIVDLINFVVICAIFAYQSNLENGIVISDQLTEYPKPQLLFCQIPLLY